MALIDFAGFEDPMAGTTGIPDANWTYSNGANGNLTGVPTPRNGAACLRSNGGSTPTQTRGGMARALSASEEHATLVCGFAIQRQSLAMGGNLFEFASDTNATCHLSCYYTIAGAIEARRGDQATGTVLATTSNLLTATGTWYYIEARATLDDTAGSLEVRFNQSAVITFSGDTKNAGTKTVFDTFVLGKGWVNNTATCQCMDDVYLLNGSGSAPLNDFLGGVAVYRHLPTGTGSVNQFTNSAASAQTNNWSFVDDQSMADYVTSGTTGQQDTYAITDLPGILGSVYGIKIRAQVQNTDGTLRTLKLGYRSGATVDMGTADSVGAGTAQLNNRLVKVNAATGTYFTATELNALEAGFEVG